MALCSLLSLPRSLRAKRVCVAKIGASRAVGTFYNCYDESRAALLACGPSQLAKTAVNHRGPNMGTNRALRMVYMNHAGLVPWHRLFDDVEAEMLWKRSGSTLVKNSKDVEAFLAVDWDDLP